MTKLTKKGEETSLPCRKIPNNWCRYSLISMCELFRVTSFQRVGYGNGGESYSGETGQTLS